MKMFFIIMFVNVILILRRGRMSIWTHVVATIRIDDFNGIIDSKKKINLEKIFTRDTYYNRNDNCNIPYGSEGSLDVEIIDRDEEGTEYMRVVTIWGDLRDYDKKDCEEIKEWWRKIPQRLGKACAIRNAVLQASSEDGAYFVLTEKDMNCFEEDDK